jgi:hypothetical protein
MSTASTTLERAMQLAGSGRCHGMTDLRNRLTREGFGDHERALFGVSMRRELQTLMARKRGAA